MNQPQALYQTDLASDLDAQIRLLQKAVDGVKDAHGALKDFMNASECWHWKRNFLDVVCDAQNALWRLQNQVGWDEIVEEAESIPRREEVPE